jgi:hypothetical protein
MLYSMNRFSPNMGFYFVYIAVLYIVIVFMFLFSLYKHVQLMWHLLMYLFFEECIIIPVFEYDNCIPFQLQLFTESMVG